MKIAFITAEYNPFHNGHLRLIEKAKTDLKADAIIVILNGDITQRGSLALLDKYTRAKHTLLSGADAVLELPQIFGVSCAERFADGAIKLAAALPAEEKILCFGSECGDATLLENAADLLSKEPEEMSVMIRDLLDMGLSFPIARARAFEEYAKEKDIPVPDLSKPNDILAIEYLRAAKKRGGFTFYAVSRNGDYKSSELSPISPSSRSIRSFLAEGKIDPIESAVPSFVFSDLKEAKFEDTFSSLLLYKLSNMSPEGLKRIADVSEGIENRIMRLLPTVKSAEELVRNAATKRYTEARIRRILSSALLGITRSFFESEIEAAPYYKVLGVKKSRTDLLSLLSAAGPLITGEEEARGSGNKSAAICALSHDIFCISKNIPIGQAGMLLL